MKNLLLTGRPGCGKTTLIKKVLEKLPDILKAGFFTDEIKDNGKRKGFRIISLDGNEGILSHVKFKSHFSVGKYKVDVDALEDIAANSLIKGRGKASLIVIDEIGKMEILSELMRLSILETLDGPKKVLASIGDIDDEYINEIKNRDDVEIIKVSVENRDRLVDEITEKIRA